jgi:hypothetical protein
VVPQARTAFARTQTKGLTVVNEDGMKFGLQAEYGQGSPRKDAILLDLSAANLGQNCPRQYPQSDDLDSSEIPESLGAPLSISDVASLIGVSVWTVRHRYLAAGLPHLRCGPQGKLLFYKNQIINWLLTEQQKGGTIR